MKYVILNDIKSLKKIKIVIIYYLVVILSTIILSLTYDNIETYKIVLGLKIEKNIILFCLFLINIFINIFISSVFILKDIENVNLFLRIKYKKWFIYKIIFITLLIILLRVIIHFIVAYLCKVKLIDLNISILFHLIISYITILLLGRIYENRS